MCTSKADFKLHGITANFNFKLKSITANTFLKTQLQASKLGFRPHSKSLIVMFQAWVWLYVNYDLNLINTTRFLKDDALLWTPVVKGTQDLSPASV